MGMATNSINILACKPNRQALDGRRISVSAVADSTAPVSATVAASLFSMTAVVDSRAALGWEAKFGAAGSGGGDFTFDITINWAQIRHLKLAALPLILAGSTRYFLPHFSQMIIIINGVNVS